MRNQRLATAQLDLKTGQQHWELATADAAQEELEVAAAAQQGLVTEESGNYSNSAGVGRDADREPLAGVGQAANGEPGADVGQAADWEPGRRLGTRS